MKLNEFKKALAFYDMTGCVKPKPNNKKKYVGVELECIFPMVKEGTILLAEKLIKAKLDNKVRMGDDGSIKIKKGQCDLELRIIDTQENIKATVIKVCSILKSMGCFVNKTCGLHVHLDMRHTSWKHKEQVFQNLLQSQNFLYSIVAKHRNRKYKYCSYTPKTFTKLVNHYDYVNGQVINTPKKVKTKMILSEAYSLSGSRKGINAKAINEHETFEIRMHEGTLSALKINKFIDILLAIVHTKDEFKKPLPIKSKGLKQLGL